MRLLDYRFSVSEARAYLREVQRVIGHRLPSSTYWSVRRFLQGDYGHWSEHRVASMKLRVAHFWTTVMVDRRVGNASPAKVDSIFDFRETAVCMFRDALA